MATTPPGLSNEKAKRILAGLRVGHTLRRYALKRYQRFYDYCDAHPAYAAEALPLLDANLKAATARKGIVWRERTETMCLKGLHPMSGKNLRIDPSRGRRACLACRQAARDNPPQIKPEVLDNIKEAMKAGASIGQICWGRPIGGGPINTALRLTTSLKFYQQRRIDPEFDRFVSAQILDSNSVGQKIRYRRARTLIRTTAARQEAKDYHAILAMLPASNPHRHDIVARIFEDMLSGQLMREDVRSRIKTYVAEFNRLYPTQFAKFGDARLYSLDAPAYRDSFVPLVDTISQRLWE